jgi:hypothetical protein
MPEEELDAAQVHTGFEQMRCEGVSHEVGIYGLLDLGRLSCFFQIQSTPAGVMGSVIRAPGKSQD